MELCNRYWHFYGQFASDVWDNMTPMQYGMLLTAIALVGYALMHNAVK